jgi:dolichyl-phosphate-mannose-protein mannosyltransferase
VTLSTERPIAPSMVAPAGTAIRPALPKGLRGWLGPVAVTLVAGILRFAHLGRPHAIVFDETYYVKDALSLLRYGYEREAVRGTDELILATGGPWDQLDVFTEKAAFVVHPPLGKWVIAAGQWALDVTPFGWRFGVALLGTLTVLLTARVVRRLTRSDLIGTVAGLLVALDGLHLVMSRTALLDTTLTFLVLGAFGLLLIDRDAVRGSVLAGGPLWEGTHGPPLGVRPYRWLAGATLGLACGVKWSGLWFVALFGLLTVAWDIGLRRQLGVRHPIRAVLRMDVLPAFVAIVVTGWLAYLATWSGWLFTSGGYDRAWAEDRQANPFVPDSLRALAEYHRAAWHFHVGLHTEHSYQSSAWSWPVMTRPTSFDYRSEGLECGAAECSAAVLPVGNPLIWWAGLVALVHSAWRAIAARDWRCGALLVGYFAGWVPWLIFHNRTIFTFYAVVMVPFLAGMLAMSLAALVGGPEDGRRRRKVGLVAAGVFLLLVIAAAWWFLPIWTGATLTRAEWRLRMWLPTWI